MIEREEEQRSYPEIIRGTQEENQRGTGPPRRFKTKNQQSTTSQEEEGFKRETRTKKYMDKELRSIQH
jgi:hypothetical protein